VTPTETEARSLDPRIRLVTMSRGEAADILDVADLGHDPFDPRQGLAFASHAFLRWLDEEADARAEDGEPPPPADSTDGPVAEWPAELQRPGWVLELTHRGHRLGLFVVVRQEDSVAPAPYALARDWLAARRVDAVCFLFVQTGEAPEHAAAILLDGWLSAADLNRLQPDPGATFVPIERARLHPMGSLFESLLRPAEVRPAPTPVEELPPVPVPVPPPFPVPPPKPLLQKLLYAAAIGGATAACVLAAILVLRKPREVVKDGEVVYVPIPPGRTVVETGFRPATIRGAGSVATVFAEQEYKFPVRAATRRKAGWLFLADKEEVRLLARLKPDDGTLAAEYSGRFDRTPDGKAFIVVLADSSPPALGTEPDQVDWLTPKDLSDLQMHLNKGVPDATIRFVRDALKRFLKEEEFDINLTAVRQDP
jgi:hypothetical protein